MPAKLFAEANIGATEAGMAASIRHSKQPLHLCSGSCLNVSVKKSVPFG